MGPCPLADPAEAPGIFPNDEPSEPAAVYQRGETVRVKYTRNNHRAGGFNRVSIVPIDKRLDRSAHRKGAFFYSCWGANVQVATEAETQPDEFGFSIT